MGFSFSDQSTDSGVKYLRIDVEGYIELADGEALGEQLDRPEYTNGRVLSVIAKGTEYSPEVRKYFPSIGHKCAHMGVVTHSPILRAAVNLMFRVVPQQTNMRMFKDVDDAVAWLVVQGA